jgi:hypothetical protein
LAEHRQSERREQDTGQEFPETNQHY